MVIVSMADPEARAACKVEERLIAKSGASVTRSAECGVG
jgi:hypothetical protein